MRYQLSRKGKGLIGEIRLPASKSISNRLLILDSMAMSPGKLLGLSDSDDTRLLKSALAISEGEVDVGHAGTAMRFLTAYFSIAEGKRILTGSARMKDRPIGQLVAALKQLGAEISYLSREGYPPVQIHGKNIGGGRVKIDSSVSSQFISALMMIGPQLKNGLIIDLENEMVSSSYIRLTAELMRTYGIPVIMEGDTIHIPHKEYPGIDHSVEADWSAASYWYGLAALSGKADLRLMGLHKVSFQGDSILPGMFIQFGVRTEHIPGGICLSRIPATPGSFEYDFRDNPDLVQTMAVLCALTGRPFHFKGTRTLLIKETDRINALGRELTKIGVDISHDPGGDWIGWEGSDRSPVSPGAAISTYQDHRMAMAFALAVMRCPEIVIEDPGVVSKSYPSFWKDLEQVGFRVTGL